MLKHCRMVAPGAFHSNVNQDGPTMHKDTHTPTTTVQYDKCARSLRPRLPHQCCCELPVSWLSVNVTACSGHQPNSPGALPWPSLSRQYCVLPTASCQNEFARQAG